MTAPSSAPVSTVEKQAIGPMTGASASALAGSASQLLRRLRTGATDLAQRGYTRGADLAQRGYTRGANLAQRGYTGAKDVLKANPVPAALGATGTAAGGAALMAGTPMLPGFASTNRDTQAYNRAAEAAEQQRGAATAENATKMLLGGLAVGGGGMALWHLLQGMRSKDRKTKKYENLSDGTPQIIGEKDAGLNDVAQKAYETAGAGWNALTGKTPQSSGVAQLAGMYPWETALHLGLGVGGLYGGKKIVDSVMEQKQKDDAADEVEEAKNYYNSVLTGTNKRAAALDAAFEKRANVPVLSDVLNAMGTIGTVGALAGGTISGKVMYDATMARSRGKNLAKMLRAKARMSNLPAMWVDPEELARIKQIANQSK